MDSIGAQRPDKRGHFIDLPPASLPLFFNYRTEATRRTRQRTRKKMALQVLPTAGLTPTDKFKYSPPTASSAPTPTPISAASSLRRPSSGYALRPSFFFFSTTSPCLGLGLDLQGAPKFTMRVASKQAYICRDCGYIYNERTPFEKLPDKFFCPVCGAPKRRFKPYQASIAKDANDTAARKARKSDLKRDETTGKALIIVAAVGVAALAGLYFYLNASF